jgi:hypothetical protein
LHGQLAAGQALREGGNKVNQGNEQVTLGEDLADRFQAQLLCRTREVCFRFLCHGRSDGYGGVGVTMALPPG